MFTKCLCRLVVDLSKAGRPAPQKKPRTKAKPFQTATVSNPIRAPRSYFHVASAPRAPRASMDPRTHAVPEGSRAPKAPKAPTAPSRVPEATGAPRAPTVHKAPTDPQAPHVSDFPALLGFLGIIGLVGLVKLTRLPGQFFKIDLGSMKQSPQTVRLPARMPSLAWCTERNRAEWNGFRGAATPPGPEYMEHQPGTPKNSSQIQNYIWNWLNSGPLRTSPILGSEIKLLRQNATPRLAHRTQQSGTSEILESRPSWPIVLLIWNH